MTFSNIKKKWALGVVADLLRENALGEPVRPVEETRLELLAILNEIAGELPGKAGHPTENHYHWAIRVEARRRCLKKMGIRRPKGQAIEDVARLLKKSHRTVEKRIERHSAFARRLFDLYEREPKQHPRNILEYYRVLFEDM